MQVSKKGYRYIKVNNSNNIVTVTLNRPDKKNAMSFAMMHELIAAATQIRSDKTVRAVIINGAGDDFCSGIDLSDLNQPKNQAYALWELVKPWQSLFQKVNLVWRDLPVPVIASIHGHCIGAGLQLVLAADVRIANKYSKLAVMEAKWGLVADMGITQAAYGVINADVLKELAMTARTVDGTKAKQLGLVTHLAIDPMDKALALAEELKTRSPDAVLASKQLINRMHKQSAVTLYTEKMWQTKLILGRNRKLALKKAKDSSIEFVKRQFG